MWLPHGSWSSGKRPVGVALVVRPSHGQDIHLRNVNTAHVREKNDVVWGFFGFFLVFVCLHFKEITFSYADWVMLTLFSVIL